MVSLVALRGKPKRRTNMVGVPRILTHTHTDNTFGGCLFLLGKWENRDWPTYHLSWTSNSSIEAFLSRWFAWFGGIGTMVLERAWGFARASVIPREQPE